MPRTVRLIAPALALAFAAALAPTRAADDKEKPAADGFTALFNGKDLTGWKLHPNPNPGAFTETVTTTDSKDVVVKYSGKTKAGKVVTLWEVKDGLLVGSGPASHLFSEKGDYTDVHFRVEAKINDKGNSGMYVRAKFEGGFPPGYETQINATHTDKIRTGSLYPDGRAKLNRSVDGILVMDTAAHKPDEFFVQETIIKGSNIRILVNGKQTVDYDHPNSPYTKGHFALQGHDPGTVVTFKRVEFKDLTAAK